MTDFSAFFQVLHHFAFKIEQFAPDLVRADNARLAPLMEGRATDPYHFADVRGGNRFFDDWFFVHDYDKIYKRQKYQTDIYRNKKDINNYLIINVIVNLE